MFNKIIARVIYSNVCKSILFLYRKYVGEPPYILLKTLKKFATNRSYSFSPAIVRQMSNGQKPLLFVGHDGIQAGSQVVLLEIIRWFRNHTNRKIKLLMLSPGPMADKYVEFADVYVLPNYSVDSPEDLRDFISDEFEFIYLNTVVSARLFGLINSLNINLSGDIITHIHEMENVLEEYPSELESLMYHAKLWISASPASSDTLIKKYGINADDVSTVSAFINPVVERNSPSDDFKLASRKELGLKPNSFVVSGCGTIYWRKGADIFLDTARQVISKGQDNIEFVWIGDGPDRIELESSLTGEEKKYIKFAGNKNNANELLSAADVFYLSSREDPFPLVVLESAQHGVPTICFETTTGITEFIGDDAGITIPDIDSMAAANTIVELSGNSSIVRQMGDISRQRLFDLYTTENQNLKIFNSVKSHTNYKPAVAFYVHGMLLSRGGIERLSAHLSNHLVEKGWEVTIFCRVHSDSQPMFPLYKNVRLVPIFDEQNVEESIVRLNSALRESKVDIFVPMLSEWLFEPIIESTMNTGVSVIASEHNDPWKIEELWWNKEKRRECFKKVDGIHLLTDQFIESLPEKLHDKVTVIPNGVSLPNNISLENRERLIIGVGRLGQQKRFDRLINAVYEIKQELRENNFKVEIYGEGHLRSDLQDQINSLDVGDLINLCGETSDMESIYRKAYLMVLPSDFEGLPMVVIESMSYGVPVIGLKTCKSLNGLISHGIDGYLAKDEQDIADTIKKLLSQNSKSLRERAIEKAKNYSIDNFFNGWENLLESVAEKTLRR